jgi:hypothetical protein
MVSLTACGQKEKIVKESTFAGKWQLIKMVETGAPVAGNVTMYDNGKTIVFNTNSKFTDNTFNCEGTYSVENNELNVSIPCSTTNKTFRYKFSFENSETLQLTQIPHACDEGCYLVFKKLK